MNQGPALQAERGYQFGPFLFNPLRRLLWKDGKVVSTTSRTLDVLQLLIEHRDRVVTKDEFLLEIWGETVVEEGTLVRHLSSLRKAMGLAHGQHDYIVTIPGHGYRFVARVTEVIDFPADLPTAATAPPTGSVVETNPTGPAPGNETPSSTLATRRFPFFPAAALAVGAFSVLGALTLWAMVRTDAAPSERAPQPASALRRITFGPGSQFEPTWSNDGEWLAYTSDRSGALDIWVQSVNDPNPVRVTTSAANDWQPDWSSDGRWLVFRSERDGGGIYVVPSRGGLERKISSFGYRPRWSADSARVLFSASMLTTAAAPRLFVAGLDGLPPRAVREDLTANFRAGLQYGWHPDGNRVSMWGRHRVDGWTFVTASLADGSAIVSKRTADLDSRMKEMGVTLRRFVWEKSGRYLYFEGRAGGVQNLWSVEVDASTTDWVSGPTRLTLGSGEDADLALSPDGRSVAFSSKKATTRIWSFPLHPRSGRLAGPGVALTSGGVNEQGADVASDGKLLFQASLGPQHELREVSLAGDGRERLLLRGEDGARRTHARWSPDGRQVVYDVTFPARDGVASTAVALLSTEDKTERLVTTPDALDWGTFGWSPDGRSIVGSCRLEAGQPRAACLMPLSGAPSAESGVRVIASSRDADLFHEQFSPDGRHLLFMAVPRLEGGRSTINLVPANGGPWTPITDGRWSDDKPRWAPDGRSIYFVSNQDGFLNVWARRIDPRLGTPVGDAFRVTTFDTPKQMLLAENLNALEIAIMSDRVVLPVTEATSEVWILDRIR